MVSTAAPGQPSADTARPPRVPHSPHRPAGPSATLPVLSAVSHAGLSTAVPSRMAEIAKHLRVSEILQAQVVVNQIVGPERDAMFAKLLALPAARAA